MTKKLLMGNEAFAHAALEAGVNVVAGYPGTPSSELVETVARLRAAGKALGVHVEWSTNEKAALEICAAASMSGARALFTCKQVGLNVASDALMSLNYVGVRGGLVLFVADDPGPISSQTEQDTRRFAEFAKVPVFDPATPEQGFAMMKAAFELSEEYGTPVIVRPTTRVNHASTFFDVEDTTQARPLPAGGFKHNPDHWVIFPKRSYQAHGEIIDRLNDMTRIFALDAHFSQFLPMFSKATAEESKPAEEPYLGIFTGGVSTQYALEALEMIERCAERAGVALPPYRFMQMGIPYPLAKRPLRRFMDGLSHILVLEELDSVLEEGLMVTASNNFLSAHVHGKLTGEAPDRGENSTESAVVAISHFFDMYTKAPKQEIIVASTTSNSDSGDKKHNGKDKRAAHRLPNHVNDTKPAEEPQIGLIGVAADYSASQNSAAPESMSQKRAQLAARRKQTHAARYKAPASALKAESASAVTQVVQTPTSQQRRKPGEAVDRDGNRLSILRLMEDVIGKKALLHYSYELPPRPPVLCAGCPHRGSFYAIKGALDKIGVKRENAMLCGDIGCYTLGNALPLNAVDTCLCMGAGITMAQGFHIAEPNKKQVAFVGDSTFFASAMTGIANAVYNNHDVTFVILDNSTTAMTGSQPHPGTGTTLMGEHNKPISIEAVLEALGVQVILRADPLNRVQAEEISMLALKHEGPSAIIFQSPCVWLRPFGIPAEVDTEQCTGCKRCITDIGCPAIAFSADARGRKSGMRGQAVIDTSLCNGCGLCLQVCPFGAIKIPSILDYAARDTGAVTLEASKSKPSEINMTATLKAQETQSAETNAAYAESYAATQANVGEDASSITNETNEDADADNLPAENEPETNETESKDDHLEDAANDTEAASENTPAANETEPEQAEQPKLEEHQELTEEENTPKHAAMPSRVKRPKARPRRVSHSNSRAKNSDTLQINASRVFGGTLTIKIEGNDPADTDTDNANESEDGRG
ncbi:thiamine pyrophosphate-dependent enzyme [Adlercreutzia sp. ZJ154]|uniref:thiamine pyrophosphate-dependent enzyme n=1 Tax=Adlercreutzia sp. ZJ154 TaxID=2709790 RepID=UPI001F151655|nr:thiamine pyrophosphate-dependent enzyme [Adlercreutzia sp. ZJ154]